MHPFANLALRTDLAAILITPKNVHTRIGWVFEHTQHPTVAQPTPYNLAIPRPTIGPLGKSQRAFHESLHHRKGGAGFAKEAKHQPHRAPHFFIGVRDNAALLVVAITDGQWETQLAFLGFVELTALEARAQKMELGLGHGPLQSEQKAVVEIRRIVAAILVDDQRLGERTQLQ